jgi:hypothetical protein
MKMQIFRTIKSLFTDNTDNIQNVQQRMTRAQHKGLLYYKFICSIQQNNEQSGLICICSVLPALLTYQCT